MKFDTIETVLKSQHFDEKQRVNIRETLTKSRYSRLSYGDDSSSAAAGQVDQLIECLARSSLNTRSRGEEASDRRSSSSSSVESKSCDEDADRVPHVELDRASLKGLLSDRQDASGKAPSLEMDKPTSPLSSASSRNCMMIALAESQARLAYKIQHQNEIIRNKLLGKKTEHDHLLEAKEPPALRLKSPPLVKRTSPSAAKVGLTSPCSVAQLKDLLTETKFSYEPKNKKKEANEAREAARLKEEREAQELVERLRLEREQEERQVAERARLAKEEQERLERVERERREKEQRAKQELEERLRKEKEAAERLQREREEQLRREKAAAEQAERDRLAKEQERQRLEKEKLEQQRGKKIQEIDEAVSFARKALELGSKVAEEAANVQSLAKQMADLESSKAGNNTLAADSSIQALREAANKLVSACQAKFQSQERARAAAAAANSQPKAGSAKSVDDNDRKGVNQSTLTGYYERYRQDFERFRQEAESALSEPALKMYKFDLQKAINFPVNSLVEDNDSEENRRSFVEKIKTITRLLSGQTCAITSTLTVSATKHPKAIDFCLVYLAKKLVDKSEETVASRPETAFQYCRIITEVCKCVSHFETIILGQFQEKCPYVVPFYKPRAPGQPLLQYQESIGYKIIDGKAEDEIQYFKRMNGIMHFYFTLLVNQPPNPSASADSVVFNNNGLKRAWQWLSDVLNMTPRPNMTAEMLMVYFKCCGHQMQRAYGQQFLKLVHACFTDYFQLIKAIPSEQQTGAYVGRLEAFYEQFRRSSQFPEWKRL